MGCLCCPKREAWGVPAKDGLVPAVVGPMRCGHLQSHPRGIQLGLCTGHTSARASKLRGPGLQISYHGCVLKLFSTLDTPTGHRGRRFASWQRSCACQEGTEALPGSGHPDDSHHATCSV